MHVYPIRYLKKYEVVQWLARWLQIAKPVGSNPCGMFSNPSLRYVSTLEVHAHQHTHASLVYPARCRCLRGAGRTQFLIRRVEIDGTKIGMTQFAQIVAKFLGITLGPSVGEFHVATPVGPLAFSSVMRLVVDV
eukprot:5589336-Prymnesium_polylepis.1